MYLKCYCFSGEEEILFIYKQMYISKYICTYLIRMQVHLFINELETKFMRSLEIAFSFVEEIHKNAND